MKQAQIIKCKCGSIVAAYCAPECYKDAEWQREIRKYARRGYDIQLIDCDKSWTLNKCRCSEHKAEEKKKCEPELF